MVDANWMHVGHCVNEHVKICSGSLLRQPTVATDQMSQLATWREFNDCDTACFVWSIYYTVDSMLSHTQVSYDIDVQKSCGHFELLSGEGSTLWVILLECKRSTWKLNLIYRWSVSRFNQSDDVELVDHKCKFEANYYKN
jgi:hypothetical protein